MNTSPIPSLTALDELLRRNPAIDPDFLAQARQAAEFLRRLGLLSTEPTEALRPFTRRRPKPVEPTSASNWISAPGIRFTKGA